jgi:16S rRNA G966 N2-methylase RsmD
MPAQIPQVANCLLQETKNSGPVKRILDGTAHIGLDSFHFAQLFPKSTVCAVEIQENAFQCLQKNAMSFAKRYTPLTKSEPSGCVLPVHADICKYILTLPNDQTFDMIYLDPPWGGPDFYKHKSLELFLSNTNVTKVIETMLIDRKLAPLLVLKVPPNFASLPKEFTQKLTCRTHHIFKPNQKHIAFSLLFFRLAKSPPLKN